MGSGALDWRENEFRLFLTPSLAVGDPVMLVYVDHPPSSVTLINELVTGAPDTGDRTTLYLAPDDTHGYLRGLLHVFYIMFDNEHLGFHCSNVHYLRSMESE
jgi:hypothetical protein